MKQFFLSFVVSISACSLWAQTPKGTAVFNNHARFVMPFADGGAYPANLDYRLRLIGFGKEATTFGGGKQGADGQVDFTWGQILQFDVAAADFAAFNSANSFSLSLKNGFTNSKANITIYASVVQYREVPVNEKAPSTMMEDQNGAGAANRWFAHQTPHKPGGPMISLGSFTPTENGELTIAGNRALNQLLSGTEFKQGRTAIYLAIVHTNNISWAPPGVTSGEPPVSTVFTGSTIQALPSLP